MSTGTHYPVGNSKYYTNQQYYVLLFNVISWIKLKINAVAFNFWYPEAL